MQPPFTLFSTEHLLALALIAFAAAAAAIGRRRASPARTRLLGRALGLVLMGYIVVAYCQKGAAGELSWEYSLPLELCHWVLAACIVSLFRPNQLASEIAYYWGFGGTLQASLTPEIGQGFPSWEFILFFWSHGATLVAMVFLVAGRGFRPRRGGVVRMLVALNIYAAIVGGIDWITGWNYGYLCHKPVKPSLMDHLGPWPWYLLSLEAIGAVSFILLDLPWVILRRYERIR
jgi:hypothetical integral membrane protein (TIGR02206 family)